MTRIRLLLSSGLLHRVAANSAARLLAIVGLALATVLVARMGGPAAVGAYALLRMLPGLLGVLCVAGLPQALAYFLAAPRRETPRLWPTLLTVAAVGAAIGTVVWCAASPLLARVFFDGDTVVVIFAAGGTVATQLLLTVGKTALQGLEDRRGGDFVIAAEELAFLPCYAAALAVGLDGTLALVAGLALADLVVAVEAWRRVVGRIGRGRLFAGAPDLRLARQVVSYGARGQLGGLMTLLNLRLDFVLLSALAGPVVLGTYAVASKFAELLRLPGTALTWVTYPELAGAEPEAAARRARRLIRPAQLVVWLPAVPLFILTDPVVRLLYGGDFSSATPQARVLIVGMLLGGAAGLASGYLYGRGRPGMNSIAMGVGLVVTVALDIVLIPRYEAMGAAVASAIAYLVADGVLVAMLLRFSGRSLLSQKAPAVEGVRR